MFAPNYCYIIIVTIELFAIRVTGYFQKLSIVNSDADIADIQSEDDAIKKLSVIYPGTKWCGAGSNAKNYNDLGSEQEADSCCRDHDNCSDYMKARTSKYDLFNSALYTRLHCSCDEKFRQCLSRARTGTARRIGKIYFNALGTKCYKMDYPIKRCNNFGGLFRRKCLEYEYDTNGNQIYQWFDVKPFPA